MKRILLGAAMVAAMAVGGVSVAKAETYVLDVNKCTDCTLTNYGTITTTGEGTTSVTISVALATDVWFNQAGASFDSFVWNLLGDPTINIATLPADWSPTGDQSAVPTQEDGLGFWDYKVNLATSNNSNLCCNTLDFTITSASNLFFTSNLIDGQNVFFGADVIQVTGADQTKVGTGMIGATLCVNGDCGHEGGGGGPVPEPATWAMMILGFGGVGWMLRRNRARTAFA